MTHFLKTILGCSLIVLLTACGKTDNAASTNPGTHTHADGTVHSNDAHANADSHDAHHDHEEVALGSFNIDGIEVEAAQGHGYVEPGKLCHLVIKLPYNDHGQSVVRGWIGSEERHKFLVGKGEYAASHDDYDIHVEAPNPLPGQSHWWVEIVKPDGATYIGSIPILEDADIPE